MHKQMERLMRLTHTLTDSRDREAIQWALGALLTKRERQPSRSHSQRRTANRPERLAAYAEQRDAVQNACRPYHFFSTAYAAGVEEAIAHMTGGKP